MSIQTEAKQYQREVEEVQRIATKRTKREVRVEHISQFNLVRFYAAGDSHGAPIPMEFFGTFKLENIAESVTLQINRT